MTLAILLAVGAREAQLARGLVIEGVDQSRPEACRVRIRGRITAAAMIAAGQQGSHRRDAPVTQLFLSQNLLDRFLKFRSTLVHEVLCDFGSVADLPDLS